MRPVNIFICFPVLGSLILAGPITNPDNEKQVLPEVNDLAAGITSEVYPREYLEDVFRRRTAAKHLRVERHIQEPELNPQPIRGEFGAPILGGTNPELDRQQPDHIHPPATDNGNVPNLKWAFSDSKTRLLKGGWVREQLVTDLPPSKDIAAAQQHLVKGAIRELHWHRVAEWGIVFNGSILISAVDENGQNTAEVLNQWDIWYFPKGVGHAVQGLADQNEYLLVFDSGDFEATGTTFNIVDWLVHAPPEVLGKNFGVNATEVFKNPPASNPYIKNANVSSTLTPPKSPSGELKDKSSYVYKLSDVGFKSVPGGAGTLNIIDSRNFPISTTIAATVVRVEPKGLREFHWHPNADEWLYFHSGTARATVFQGNGLARTFDFRPGDTAVFPDNTGHYIENTSETEELVWVEIYKSDRVADIPLSQWLALTPPDLVAQLLNVSPEFVKSISKTKQVLVNQKTFQHKA
ncbi:oxalate decarboxylase [Drechslerella dactyloides]|uniref:Oxalate decarboxylase n=1 Tax=Drechslerella dactyloides TaxID=74499 RepID=A0AAD6J7I5_DREDA|nr:oxalate decarboxylase [Drechslerella dactyloides]